MEWYKTVINEQQQLFINAVRRESDANDHTHFANRNGGFPIFTDNETFAEQKFFDERIEYYLWRYLLNGVIERLFSSSAITEKDIIFEKVWKNPQLTVSYVDETEERFPIEFVIVERGVRTGYRYTNWYATETSIETQLIDKKLNKVIVLDFSSEKKSAFLHPFVVPRQYSECVLRIQFRDFILKYFSEEIYDHYIYAVTWAIAEANKYVGLKTVRNLSKQSLPFFLKRTLHMIRDANLETYEYKVLPGTIKIENWVKAILSDPNNIIGDSDYSIMNDNFYNKGRFLSLAGAEDFAHSFITSEYLYMTMSENSHFDYTAIVCGYLKAVEQLVYKLALFTLNNSKESLWIKKNKKKCKDPNDLRNDMPRREGTPHILFKAYNKKCFDTTFGPLVNLLNDNRKGWNISEGAKNYICARLVIYKDECRNEHFHKDNINNIEEVEIIRNNTWMLLYCLLGGYRLFDNDEDNNAFLGIHVSVFDKMYNSLMKKETGPGNYYILNFKNNGSVYAALPLNQKRQQYDDNGIMINPELRFIQIERDADYNWETDDWHVIENDYKSSDVIYVTPDNMPESIFYIDKLSGKRTEIIW